MNKKRSFDRALLFPHENVMFFLEREQTILRTLYENLESLSPAERNMNVRLPFNPCFPLCLYSESLVANGLCIGPLTLIDGWILHPIISSERAQERLFADSSINSDNRLFTEGAQESLFTEKSSTSCNRLYTERASQIDLSPYPPLPAVQGFLLGYTGSKDTENLGETLLTQYQALKNESKENLNFPLKLRVWKHAMVHFEISASDRAWNCSWQIAKAKWKKER